jgi:phage FluMu protein Com
MPIRFRCSYCNRLLGIATRKAGTETTCPHCGYTITVPVPEPEDGRTERMNLEDVDAMLGHGATEVVQPAAVAAPPAEAAPLPAAAASPPAAPKPRAAAPKPVPTNPDERPLFEQDMEDIFGKSVAPAAEPERGKPKVSGMDAMSLSEPSRQIVLTGQTATLLMILVVVLLVIAFATGYFIAPKG